MKKGLVEVVMVVDRSGSMCNMMEEAIGSCNAVIKDHQTDKAKDTRFTLALFDHEYDLIHNGVRMRYADYLNSETCYARGSTSLLDAVGRTINMVGTRLCVTPEQNRPEQVLFVIMTDGYENSSKEFTYHQVQDMINHQEDRYNWNFLFLGSNIDAKKAGTSIGIQGVCTYNFAQSVGGFRSVSSAINYVSSGLSCGASYKNLCCSLDNSNLENSNAIKKGSSSSDSLSS